MQTIKMFILLVNCNLADINIVINDFPIYKSSSSDKKYFQSINLNPFLRNEDNFVELSIKNNWSDPERLPAFCDVSVIEKSQKSTKELKKWHWDERKTPINFKVLEDNFKFKSSHDVKHTNQIATSSTSIESLLNQIVFLINRKDIHALVDNYFKVALYNKHLNSDSRNSEFISVEMDFWQNLLSRPYKVYLNWIPEYNLQRNGYVIAATDNGKEPIIIDFEWGQVGLGFILEVNDNNYHIISIDYIVREKWKK